MNLLDLQFKKTRCACVDRSVREVINQELTQEIRLSDGLPDLGRILATWGCVILRGKEWMGDAVRASGGVQVWVLYAPEDGSQPRCVDAWIPFQTKWDLPQMDQEGFIRLKPILRFADSRLVSARKLLTRVGIGITGEVLTTTEHEVYACEEIPEDVQLLRRTYPVRLPREAGEKNLLLDEEVDMTGRLSDVEKILGYWACPELTERKVQSDKIVFRGNLHLHVIGAGAEGDIRTGDIAVPFSQFAELDGSYSPDAQATVVCCVTSLELGRNEGTDAHLKCGMVCQYAVSDLMMLELTEDAYSPRRELGITLDELNLPVLLDEQMDTVTAELQISGHTGEIVDLFFLPDNPRAQRTEEGYVLEIPGVAQVLYQDESGMLQGVNSRWDTSWKITAGESSKLYFDVEPLAQVQPKVNADALQIRGQITLRTVATTDQGIPMVTSLELGEQQDPDQSRPSVILCRMGTESLWSLAKRCGSTEEAIMQANHLTCDPVENTMLLIPVI